MHKILFFDIDGTLAYPLQSPAHSVVDAIRQARNNGHKAFISTGRTWDSVPQAVADIGFDGGIFSAGGIVLVDQKPLAYHYMAEETAQAILNFLKQKNIFYVLETPDGRFHSENGSSVLSEADMSNVTTEMKNFTTSFLLEPDSQPLSKYSGQPIFKIAYHVADPKIPELLTTALNGVAKIVPFNNISGFPIFIGEISDPYVNKGNAMMDVYNYYNKTAMDCVAFGDSMNDAEIIRAAGLGVAMGNAEQALKDIANLVCDNCENDGILLYFSRIFLQKRRKTPFDTSFFAVFSLFLPFCVRRVTL